METPKYEAIRHSSSDFGVVFPRLYAEIVACEIFTILDNSL